MIVVEVSLWPHGDPTRKKHLGTAVIANDATGSATKGNYRVSLSQRGLSLKTWKCGHIRGFPRRRLGAWDLLLCALAGICGPRTKGLGIESSEVEARAARVLRARHEALSPQAKRLLETPTPAYPGDPLVTPPEPAA